MRDLFGDGEARASTACDRLVDIFSIGVPRRYVSAYERDAGYYCPGGIETEMARMTEVNICFNSSGARRSNASTVFWM